MSIRMYVEACEIIEEFGLTNVDGVLAHIWFRVQWKGLDVHEATIGLQ